MRDHLVNLALKLVGCPYIWGGGNPWTGLDCSGFVVWIYQVFGLLPSGDWTAQGLYERYEGRQRPTIEAISGGDLMFYGPAPGRITHVMLALGGGLVVGASGGDSRCTSVEEAHRRGAMVKVKAQSYRSDLQRSLHVPMPGD